MRSFLAFVLIVLLGGLLGCGKSGKPDNSDIQTPNDQPIGMPKQLGGDSKPAQLGGKGGGKEVPLPIIEIKP
jgi:hypothetical protein